MPKYTALIKIVEVNETSVRDRGENVTKKDSRELIDLEVRGNTLGKLIDKVQAHLSLVDGE